MPESNRQIADITQQTAQPAPLMPPSEAVADVAAVDDFSFDFDIDFDVDLEVDLDVDLDLQAAPFAPQSSFDIVEDIFPTQLAEDAQSGPMAPPVPSVSPDGEAPRDYQDLDLPPPEVETVRQRPIKTPFGDIIGTPVEQAPIVDGVTTEAEIDDADSTASEADGDGFLPAFGFDDILEAEPRAMRIGHFSLLNKVTAKVRPIALRLGEPLIVDDLSIVMHDCLSTPPEDPPETKAFLRIVETQKQVEKLIFSGWMFASSPGINALEHPVHDLWPKKCLGEDGLVFTGEAETIAGETN